MLLRSISAWHFSSSSGLAISFITRSRSREFLCSSHYWSVTLIPALFGIRAMVQETEKELRPKRKLHWMKGEKVGCFGIGLKDMHFRPREGAYGEVPGKEDARGVSDLFVE